MTGLTRLAETSRIVTWRERETGIYNDAATSRFIQFSLCTYRPGAPAPCTHTAYRVPVRGTRYATRRYIYTGITSRDHMHTSHTHKDLIGGWGLATARQMKATGISRVLLAQCIFFLGAAGDLKCRKKHKYNIIALLYIYTCTCLDRYNFAATREYNSRRI